MASWKGLSETRRFGSSHAWGYVVLAVLTVLTFQLGGCAGRAPAPDPADLIYAPELGIDLASMTLTPEGLYYEDLVLGTGDEVRRNRRVSLHFMGWFISGELFDSSVTAGGPIQFTVGQEEVIRGWELGIVGMKVGGQRRMVIPPRLAYGFRGIPGAIPGNTTLVFEIQLLRVGR